MTLLVVVAVAAFISLGHWQWSKGNLRARQAEAFAHGAGTAERLGPRMLADVQRFQRVRVKGRLDTKHQFLLDNRSNEGRPGYEVLTPLYREAAERGAILVNRGWVPFSGYREKLPDVSFTSEGDVEVTGRVDELPVQGLASGHAPPTEDEPWPKVTSFPQPREMAEMLRFPLESRVLLLDADQPNGYVRQWQPPGMTADRHWSYGVQWYAFAVLAIALWVILGMRKKT